MLFYNYFNTQLVIAKRRASGLVDPIQTKTQLTTLVG